MKTRVWHIPQIPGKPFLCETNDYYEAEKIQDTLAFYDLFLLEENVRPDFSNCSGIQIYDEDGEEWVAVEDKNDWDVCNALNEAA